MPMNDERHRKPIDGSRQIPYKTLAWAGLLCSVALLTSALVRAWRAPLTFDDAFMYYRYAKNVQAGHGISWNSNGVHTYGLTSLPWLLFVIPAALAPLSVSHALEISSWGTGIAALAVIVSAVTTFAKSTPGSYWPAAAALVAVPLSLNPDFVALATTGMDTMLALAANALLVLALLRFRAEPSAPRAWLTGFASVASVLIRPDSGLCAILGPALTWYALGLPRRWGLLVPLAVFPLTLIAAYLLLCHLYFGSALPLGFYAKTGHAYAGYVGSTRAAYRLFLFGNLVSFFLALCCGTIRRKQWAEVLPFFGPACLTALYLLTVRQIMGLYGRFYLPLLPFFVIPALLVFDDFIARADRRMEAWRLVAALLLVLVLGPNARSVQGLASALDRQRIAPIDVPILAHRATRPLATTAWLGTDTEERTRAAVAEEIVRPLPKGAVVAASEVGYLGAIAPQVDVVDLVGLNDTQIGIRGFSMDYLLSTPPDFIWFAAQRLHWTALADSPRSTIVRDLHGHSGRLLLWHSHSQGQPAEVVGGERREDGVGKNLPRCAAG